MFEKRRYIVNRIAGDYAYLVPREISAENGNCDTVFGTQEEEKCVARALLPEGITEGCALDYEMMQYEIAKD